MSYKLYMHGGSKNHGCEAIIRTTVALLDESVTLYSKEPGDDAEYKLNEVCEIRQRGSRIKRFELQWWIRQFKKRILKDKYAFIKYNYSNIIDEAKEDDIYLSVGGDNYCGQLVPALKYTNKMLKNKNAKTVLWGCSIDPQYIQEVENRDDLKLYDLIWARDKTTYQELINNGLDKNTRYFPDPAFTLRGKECPLPRIFDESEVIGVNISPYVQKNGKNDIVVKNYEKVIEYILDNTEYGVALIPHVVWKESNDLKPIRDLYEKYKETNRVICINDMNCENLKFVISKCKMLIAARTHASIAAYSTQTPCLVVGYSMKATAIAKDIFGTSEKYVIQAKEMKNDESLLETFKWHIKNYENTKNILKDEIPQMINAASLAGEEMKRILNEK